MGRKSSKTAAGASPMYHEAPGCFNGIWNGSSQEADDTPVIARKSLSERKFSEGFEAPRNSLDIGSALFESARSNGSVIHSSDEIPFGFEFSLRKSLPPRISVNQSSSSSDTTGSRCRSPSVIARLMGLETLPDETPRAPSPLPKQQQQQQQQQQNHSENLQSWKLLERKELLTSRSTREPPRSGGGSTEKHRFFSRQLSTGSRLQESRPSEDEFLLFDILPFRDHPQEKQLEKLKHEFQARRQIESAVTAQHHQQQQEEEERKPGTIRSLPIKPSSSVPPEKSKEMRDAIQFLQSNKEFMVKFLQDPNSLFSKHIYDLAPPPPSQESAPCSRSVPKSSPSQARGTGATGATGDNNIGFSRKLVESKRENHSPRTGISPPTHSHSKNNNNPNNNNNNLMKRKESDSIHQRQRKESPRDRIILLKPNLHKQSISAPCSPAPRTNPDYPERSRSFKESTGSSVDPRALARQIARQVRENVDRELLLSSEPSSRRYTKELQPQSLPSSPKLRRGEKQAPLLRGRNHSEEESLFIQIELTKAHQAEDSSRSKQPRSGKLLKLFAKDSGKSSVSGSDHSPRMLVRSKSVPGFVEEKSEPHEALERTQSCRQQQHQQQQQSSGSKGKFSSLKTSLLGGKKKSSGGSGGTTRGTAGGSTGVSSRTNGTTKIEHSVSPGDEDPYTRTFRETEAQLASSYQPEHNKFAFDPVSPSYLSVDIGQGLDHLDASSDIHLEKSEQPSPVSVLERGFIEESPSPVSFEEDSTRSDLQELQIRLERLKLDESGRTFNPEREENDPTSPSESPSPYVQDNLYIAKVLQASGLDRSVRTLHNWHKARIPMDPFLFGKVEEEYSSCETPSSSSTVSCARRSRTNRKLEIGPRSCSAHHDRVERRPEALHRQMLFDVVNEIVAKGFGHVWSEQAWHEIGSGGGVGVRKMVDLGGRSLIREVVREVDVFRHEHQGREYPLEKLVERDVKRGGGGGGEPMEMREELRKIMAEVEVSILDGLVEEMAASLSLNGET